MSSSEVPVLDTDGALAAVVPVPADHDHIPAATLALLVADQNGQLLIRHYELQLHPLEGAWVYTTSHDEVWEHPPLSDPDSETPLAPDELLNAQDWPAGADPPATRYR